MDDAGVLPRLGPGQVVVHDGWKPYRKYTGVKHALCNAHHLRELAGIAEDKGQEWAASMADLLRDAHEAVKKAKAGGKDALDPGELAGIQHRYRQNIAAGKKANPPRPGRKQSKAYNLLARLDTERDDVLRFTVDFKVPFDNNQAERDIRTPKLKPKISGCMRTVEGAEDFAALRSYLSTAVKHGRNLLDVLARLVRGDPWMPPAPA
jgi:transposase